MFLLITNATCNKKGVPKVSIHLMFLLIEKIIPVLGSHSAVSIHLMFLLIIIKDESPFDLSVSIHLMFLLISANKWDV